MCCQARFHGRCQARAHEEKTEEESKISNLVFKEGPYNATKPTNRMHPSCHNGPDHIGTYSHRPTHTHTHTHTQAHTYTNTGTHTGAHTHTHTGTHIHKHAGTHTGTHTRSQMNTHTHTHKPTTHAPAV